MLSHLFRTVILFAVSVHLGACFHATEDKKPFEPPAPKPTEPRYHSEGSAENFITLPVNPLDSHITQGTVDFGSSYYQFPLEPGARFQVVLAQAIDQPAFRVYADAELTTQICQSRVIVYNGLDAASCVFDNDTAEGAYYLVVSGENTRFGSTYRPLVRWFRNEGLSDAPVPLSFPTEHNGQVANGQSYYQFDMRAGERYRVAIGADESFGFQVATQPGNALCSARTETSSTTVWSRYGQCEFVATEDGLAVVAVNGQALIAGDRYTLTIRPIYQTEGVIDLVVDSPHVGTVSEGSISRYRINTTPFHQYTLAFNREIGDAGFYVTGYYGAGGRENVCRDTGQDTFSCTLAGYTGIEIDAHGTGQYGGRYTLHVAETLPSLPALSIASYPYQLTADVNSEPNVNGVLAYTFDTAWHAGIDRFDGMYSIAFNPAAGEEIDIYIDDSSGMRVCNRVDVTAFGATCEFTVRESGFQVYFVARGDAQQRRLDFLIKDLRVNMGTDVAPETVFKSTSNNYSYKVASVGPVAGGSESVFQIAEDIQTVLDGSHVYIDQSTGDVAMEVFDATSATTPICTSDRAGTVVEKCALDTVTPPVQVRVTSNSPYGAYFRMYVDDGRYPDQGVNQPLRLPLAYNVGTVSAGGTSSYEFAVGDSGSYQIVTGYNAEDISVSMAMPTRPACHYDQPAGSHQIRGCRFENLASDQLVSISVRSSQATSFKLFVVRIPTSATSPVVREVALNRPYAGIASPVPGEYVLRVTPLSTYELNLDAFAADVSVKVEEQISEGVTNTLCDTIYSRADNEHRCAFTPGTASVLLTFQSNRHEAEDARFALDTSYIFHIKQR